MIEWHDLFSDIYYRRKKDSKHGEGSHHGNAILYIKMMDEQSSDEFSCTLTVLDFIILIIEKENCRMMV